MTQQDLLAHHNSSRNILLNTVDVTAQALAVELSISPLAH